MGFIYKGIRFEGPFRSAEHIRDEPGVYVILCSIDKMLWQVVKAGHTRTLKSTILTQDYKMLREQCEGKRLSIIVKYTDSAIEQKQIIDVITGDEDPPCQETDR